jgi:hypothetical protein
VVLVVLDADRQAVVNSSGFVPVGFELGIEFRGTGHRSVKEELGAGVGDLMSYCGTVADGLWNMESTKRSIPALF